MNDHHEWVRYAADRLAVPGNVLWQGMCAEWAQRCLSEDDVNQLGDAVFEAIAEYRRGMAGPAAAVNRGPGARKGAGS